MIILAIESSCDETAAAVLKDDRGDLVLLSNIVSSQIDIHKQYGGVVPEVAARHHITNIIPVISEALMTAKIKNEDIDLIAVTAGPGLLTSLIVGVETAKGLSASLKKPLLAVNHMYGHIAANFLENKVEFPAVCLVVSGGHTEIVVMKDPWHMKKVGQTIDDAAGEAFDKVAKLLDLGYPGGPMISAYAEKFYDNFPYPEIKLPRPMIKSPNFDFSFSGLKTAVLYASQKVRHKDENFQIAMSYYFQEAVTEVLVTKTIKAAKKFGAKTIMMAGGVAANKRLRAALADEAQKNKYNFNVPAFKYCTDNAAMIAVAAYYQSLKKKAKATDYLKITADTNWELN